MFLDLQDNRELINEGESFIIDCIKKNFQDKYLPDVVHALQSYLTSESMLSHVASHMGVKDLILSAVKLYKSCTWIFLF